MVRRPPRSTRPDTPVPYTPLCRSDLHHQVAPQHRIVADLAVVHEQPAVVPERMAIGFLGRRVGGRSDVRHEQRRLDGAGRLAQVAVVGSEEHTSELQSLMRISYAVFCLKKKTKKYKRQ